jgi:polysaccharide biosynthesis/export protein
MDLMSCRNSAWARFAGAALVLSAALSIAGCAGSQRRVVRQEMLYEFTAEQRAAIAGVQTAAYRLQSGDKFAVESLVDDELRQDSIIVLPDGTASFVDLGNMTVKGLTIPELEQTLNAAYSRNYRDVALSVVLKELAGLRVYVLGEVRNAGLYNVVSRGSGVLGAIAQAGGFTEWAGHASVVLMRMTPEGYLIRELDLTTLRKGEDFDTASFDLQPYDIVYVNRSKIGDFAAFAKNVIGSLEMYSRTILEVRQIANPDIYRR